MIRARRIVLCLLASSLAMVASCSSQKDINPEQIVKLMYTDDSKTLPFKKSDTKMGEYGAADIVDENNVNISLSYTKGQAYKGDVPPQSANEIATDVSGSYSYCVSGVNGNLTGQHDLAQLLMPPINHLVVSLLHPDIDTLDSYKQHLPEASTLIQNMLSNKGGATSGKGYDGADETYYIYGGWLWRWGSNDNFGMLCAYPIVH
jgi:hypothetical protein